MKITKHLAFLVAASALVAITGCKKDDEEDDDDSHVHHHGVIELALNYFFGVTPFDMNDEYSDSQGTKIKFDRVQFYLSNISFMDMNMNMAESYPDVYLLGDASVNPQTWEIGEAEEGHLHMMRFYTGLDSTTNHADPTLADAPLNDASMHWGWNPSAGYKFVVLEGQYDSDADNIVDAPFVYHMATDVLLRTSTLMVHTDIVEGQHAHIHVNMDLEKMISGIDVASTPDTHTSDHFAVAEAIMDSTAVAYSH